MSIVSKEAALLLWMMFGLTGNLEETHAQLGSRGGCLQTGESESILSAPDLVTLIGARHFVTGYPAVNREDGSINVVIEIPTGSSAKWEVDKSDGILRWEYEDGTPRVVDYLAYPGNYGMVPGTLLPTEFGGDGDPLDVLVLGPSLDRGSIVRARVIGVLEMEDEGELDHKLIAVTSPSPFAGVMNLSELERDYPGVTNIIEIWFANYKGPGRIKVIGYGDHLRADRLLRKAIASFDTRDSRD